MVGISLGPDRWAAAEVVREPGGGPRLTWCGHWPIHDAGRLAAELTELARSRHWDKTPIASVMEPGSFNLLLVEAPEVDPSELMSAMRWRIKDMLDFHIDDAVIDVFDIPGQKERGRPRMMYVVAARAASVQERIDLMEGAGVNLTVLDIPELAQRNVAALLPEDAAGVAVLSFGARGGLITLTHQSTLYLARAIDVGLDTLNAVGAAQKGSGSAFANISPDVSRGLDNVVIEVQRSLEYYESRFSQPPISTLVVAPLAQELPGFSEYLAAKLGVGVRMLDLNAALDSSAPLAADMQALCFAAIGAALRVE